MNGFEIYLQSLSSKELIDYSNESFDRQGFSWFQPNIPSFQKKLYNDRVCSLSEIDVLKRVLPKNSDQLKGMAAMISDSGQIISARLKPADEIYRSIVDHLI